MTFSINFLTVLGRTIDGKILDILYEDLSSFKIIIGIDFWNEMANS